MSKKFSNCSNLLKNWQSSFDSHRLPRDIEMSSEVESNLVFNRARQYLLLIIQLIFSAVGGSFLITQPQGWERTFTVTGYVTIERLFRKKCQNTEFRLFDCERSVLRDLLELIRYSSPLHHSNNQHPAARVNPSLCPWWASSLSLRSRWWCGSCPSPPPRARASMARWSENFLDSAPAQGLSEAWGRGWGEFSVICWG